MSTPTADTPTVDHAAEPQSDLWTSDSERGLSQSDSATPTPPVEIDEPDQPDPPIAASPEPPTPDQARNDQGQFAKGQKKRDNPISRMKDATAKEAAAKEEARLAREEATRLRAELDAARRPASPQVEPARHADPPKPWQPKPFVDFDTWLEKHPDAAPASAYEQYSRELAQDVWDQNWQRTQAQQQEQSRHQAHRSRVETFRAAHPDYDAVINGSAGQLTTSAAMQEAILGSDRSADLVYWLATHPDQCTQLAGESAHADPAQAALWMRRYLESQLTTGAANQPETASVVRPSAARPPVSRVGGTATLPPVDPDDLPFGPDYIKAENAREREAQKAGTRW